MPQNEKPDTQSLYRPGVGIILMNKEGKIFLGMRHDSLKNADHEFAWQMPQGGIDAGEEPVDAALRELEEETGVPAHAVTVLGETPDWLFYDLPKDLQTKLWGGRYKGQRHKWFLTRLEGPDSLINIHHPTTPEFCAWRWATQDEAQSHVVDFKQDLYRAVFSYFYEKFTSV